MISNGRIKVLVVDDSAIVRKVLTEVLESDPGIEVVGAAPDPYVARDKILALQPDVLTLDIEMPRMDGLTFLKKLMHFRPMPVIVISSLTQSSSETAIKALGLGAVDVLGKPGGPYSVGDLKLQLPAKIRAASAARVHQDAAPPSPSLAPSPAGHYRSSAVIAIGASTGGTEAIRKVMSVLPGNLPGIVITQHIPPGFSLAFSQSLNQSCAAKVKEAVDGDELKPGTALVAPGNLHMQLQRSGSGYRVTVKDGPRVCYQRPSVDVLFASVARAAGADAVGVILTGMGADGAQGMAQMKQAGARTIAQDEASCVVFGMPREAIQLKAVDQVLALDKIPAAIMAGLPR
jgi:two-component system, chemotaxis family, protein-glutamate methylesterase/glutaminase